MLLPLRSGWPDADVGLLLAVVVVAVAATGNRVAGGLAVAGAVWFKFFFTLPYERFTVRSSPDVTTFVLLLVVGVEVSQQSCRRFMLRPGPGSRLAPARPPGGRHLADQAGRGLAARVQARST